MTIDSTGCSFFRGVVSAGLAISLSSACGGPEQNPPAGTPPGSPPAMETTKKTYSLGSTFETAWAGGAGTGVPNPMQVTKSDCTHGLVAANLGFKAPMEQTPGTMNLGCVQVLGNGLSTNVSLSTTIGYGTMPPAASSSCPSGSAVIGIRFGTGTGYWLRVVAPLCAELEAWSDTSKSATPRQGAALGASQPTSVVQCPQGSLLSGVHGVIGSLDYALDPPLRASCTEVVVKTSPL